MRDEMDFSEWVNILPYEEDPEKLALEDAHWEKYNIRPDFIYFPQDITLEEYLNAIRTALETDTPLEFEPFYPEIDFTDEDFQNLIEELEQQRK